MGTDIHLPGIEEAVEWALNDAELNALRDTPDDMENMSHPEDSSSSFSCYSNKELELRKRAFFGVLSAEEKEKMRERSLHME